MSAAWLQVLTLDFAVLGIAALVLLADAFALVRGRVLGWLVAALLLAVLAASFVVDINGEAPHHAYVSGPWVLFFKRVFLVAGVLGVLGAVDWLFERAPGRQAEYYALMLFSIVGMMLVPGARDWVLMVIAFELMGVPLYVLSAYAKTDGGEGASPAPRLGAEAGLKLFVTGVASSAITLFGLALVVGMTGTTSLSSAPGTPSPLAAAGMLLVLAGFGFKVGAVPFHMWVPDTYQGAPTPFVAFLSVAPKAGGLAALAVVLLSGWGQQFGVWEPALAVIAAASLVVGNLFALPQTDSRRLLAFSGIAQVGYALVALCTRTELGLATALFFIATYVFTNLGVFLVVHVAAQSSGGHGVARLAGLSRRSPWLGATLRVSLLSLAGIPFVVGFWAKLFVFLAAYKAGLLGLVIAGIALAVVGLFYYLSVARSTFMSDGESAAPIRTTVSLKAAIVVCLVAVVGLGLYPRPLVDEAVRAASSFLGGH